MRKILKSDLTGWLNWKIILHSHYCTDKIIMTMVIRDAWLIALANSLTSIFAGFVVFGTLGTLAQVGFILFFSKTLDTRA